MRLLSKCIVHKGTDYNDKDRVTYRGISKKILPGIKVGDTFRIANWAWTSESKTISKRFASQYGEDQLIVEFCIKKGWHNAGRIYKIGESCYAYEKETLIPPYTVLTLKSRTKNYAVWEVAKDNKGHDFNMRVSWV